MPFYAVLSRESEVAGAVARCLRLPGAVVRTPSRDGLLRLVRERPVTAVVLDGGHSSGSTGGLVRELRTRFPSVGVVLLAGAGSDPRELLRLGRAGIDSLLFVSEHDRARELPDALARAERIATAGLVEARMSVYLGAREVRFLRLALHGTLLAWGAEDFARAAGLTRPHLSVRLKSHGLPSAGHLLVWSRLLHAGRWLGDPGRSAESVSRQLEYSSGAAFRRALREYTGLTPTAVRERGGLTYVLDRFRAVHAAARLAARSA